MSSAAEGWYVDPSTGTNLRFWNGSTWTDEVAPLADDAAHASQRGLTFDADEPPSDAAAEHVATQDADLDTDLERTRLTRRELRARRGADSGLDDSPRHLSPAPPPPAAPPDDAGHHEELEIPPAEAIAASGDPADAAQRRIRIVRLSVLLGILAVVSGVAVLTGGAV